MSSPATAYRRGRSLEYRVLEHLKERHWVVIRSAGSSGAADLWAAQDGRLLLIQVKRDPRTFGSREWNTLLFTAEQAGGEAVLVSAAPRGPLLFEKLLEPRPVWTRFRPVQVLEL